MLAGENIHILVVISRYDDNPTVTAFARLSDAREAFHDALAEAMERDNVESMDALDEYVPGEYFVSSGNSAEVRTLEVE